MRVNVGTGLVTVELSWPAFDEILHAKGLQCQYVENTIEVTVFAIDLPIVYVTSLFKGQVPPVCDWTQAENDAWKAEFEAEEKPISNHPIEKRQKDNASRVAVVGREGSESIQVTHNYADPTTWFMRSVRRPGAVLVDTGDGLTFASSHPFWIDMTHGKVHDEDAWAQMEPHHYAISLAVDGVMKTQRAPFATSGGDYTVNYAAGTITSVSGSWTGLPVVCDFSYANFVNPENHPSDWILSPEAGKALDLEYAEVQFSDDTEMNDTVITEVWGYVDVFAPQLVNNPFPPGTKIPLQGNKYKTYQQIIDEAISVTPPVPVIGGPRGSSRVLYCFPFRYGSIRRLWASLGMELRVYLEGDTPYGGYRTTASFYCISYNETDLRT